MEPIRVVIADDSALVLAGVEAMLADGIRATDSADASSPPIEVCGRASSLGELYAQVAASAPDVVVTDCRGGSFVDPTVVGLLVAHQRREASSPLSRLTVRETEILAAIATGKSNVAIGEQLFVGQRAVEKHINSIFAKLDLHEDPDANRRVRAVLLFLRAGLPH